MACSNASQYIQHISSKPLPSPLSTSPKFTPASLTVHSILQSKLNDAKTMPPETFAELLQTTFDDCTKTDQSMILYEIYIFFLFTQILREIMSHLVIHDNAPYFSLLNEQQTQLILTITHLAGPLSFNFGFNRALPNAEDWARSAHHPALEPGSHGPTSLTGPQNSTAKKGGSICLKFHKT